MKIKKLFMSVLATGMGVMALSSCSSDEPVVNGQPGDVTFSVQLPADMATRADMVYGDGQTATTLYYAIYEQGATAGTEGCALVTGTATFNNLTATVTERLLPGKTYKAAFWAANTNSPYTFNADAMTMTVNTDNLYANDENGDGFYGSLENISTKEGAYSGSATLVRPFAQVNVGTNDYDRADALGLDLKGLTTSLSFTGVATTLNLFTGETSGSADAVFKKNTMPANATPAQTFPVAGDPAYKYMAMSYVLMPKATDKETITVNFLTSSDAVNPGENPIVWTSVPVQRNYRTNIYGSLLTNPAQITVTIDPNWGKPDYEVKIWDGVTVTEPQVVDGAYQVSTPAEWVYLAKNPSKTRANYNINITASLDFGGFPVPAMYVTGPSNNNGVLSGGCIVEGNNNTLSNFTFPAGKGGKGLFNTYGFTLQNITIQGVKYTQNELNPFVDEWMGAVFGLLQDGNCNALIKNVTLKDINLNGVQSVGAFGGAIMGASLCVIENCTVNGAKISNQFVAGESGFTSGLVGKSTGMVAGSGNVMENVTINALYVERRGVQSNQKLVGYYEGTDPTSIATVTAAWNDANCTFTNTFAPAE